MVTSRMSAPVAEEDPAVVFDQLLELSRHRVSLLGSGSSSRVRIHLRREPQAKYLPEKRREIATVDETVKNVFRELLRGEREWPLFIHGIPGTGKTCAALALSDYLHPEEVQYTTASDLASRYMDSWKAEKKFDWSAFGAYREIPNELAPRSPAKRIGSMLVILDELGTRMNVSDTHYECVQKVLDMREGWPLIVISNKAVSGIAALYDARIASRCASGTVVELKGKDRRLS